MPVPHRAVPRLAFMIDEDAAAQTAKTLADHESAGHKRTGRGYPSSFVIMQSITGITR
jgi:hypothetical protein